MTSPASANAAAKVARWWHRTWGIVVEVTRTSVTYRVTGLAAEAAFFAILSLPPLIFGLAGSIGYIFARLSPDQIITIREAILDLVGRAFTPEAVSNIIEPTLDDVIEGGRVEIVSIGFLLALWSGSRALNVFVDTVTIMYGLSGYRGIIATRTLSFGLYAAALLMGVVTLPLIVLGPGIVSQLIPAPLEWLMTLYWPVVTLAGILFLALLYHVSVPIRIRLRYNLPGATFTMACWFAGSWLLREFLGGTAGASTSIYGPLAAPIAVLLVLYILAIAVLIGAALNAAIAQQEIASADENHSTALESS